MQSPLSANVSSGTASVLSSIEQSRPTLASLQHPDITPSQPMSAIVYCEGEFGAIDGKTANGLIRHSERYRIVSVIDSSKQGRDAGEVLTGNTRGIPICADLATAIEQAGGVPDYFIFGKAPASGRLTLHERGVLLTAMRRGMNIVNGLHEFLSEDAEFIAASKAHHVTIVDIRKPRAKKDLHAFRGVLNEMKCCRIAVLGTDCAIGKRTTATLLTKALNAYGVKAILVNTGQTGLVQGARYGLALDAVPSQFCAGELEATIVDAFNAEHPDVIVIEGQGALSHPAYSTSSFILRGSVPQGVILQHAPGRTHRCDFEKMAMPTVASEINLIETFAPTQVIGLTLNHEHMRTEQIEDAIAYYKRELHLPVTDALTRPTNELLQMALSAFPELAAKAAPSNE